MEIGLTPTGTLRVWQEEDAPGALARHFARDWREGFIALASSVEAAVSPGPLFWRRLAERFLLRLCHRQTLHSPDEVEPLTGAEVAELVISAPPMPGSEYLGPESLAALWHSVAEWCVAEATIEGGLAGFLSQHAPRWHAVGRVTFHMAENKGDEARPFAFMATYVAGLGASGQQRHLPLGKALTEYASDRAALIKLLTPLHDAGERLPWVKTLVEDGTVYRPVAWNAEQAYRLLLDVPALEACGLAVRIPNWWAKRPRPRVSVQIGSNTKASLGLDSMLDFKLGVALGSEELSEEELAQLLTAGSEKLVLLRGNWVEVDGERLKEAIDQFQSLKAHGELSFIEGMRLLAGAPADLGAEDATRAAAREWVDVEAGGALKEALATLRGEHAASGTAPVPGLEATLRPYQRRGADWLHFLQGLGLGACLADDMGLGKTMQVLALLLRLRAQEGAARPSLLIVPASLIANWRHEAERFAPSLRAVYAHPSETPREALDTLSEDPGKALAGVDLVVTSYALATRMAWLGDIDWRLVILDEAQAIKNPGTRQTKSVKKLKAAARIALTGTPVENRLGDLWSIFDFINPGLLGGAKAFSNFASSLKSRPTEQYAPLRRLVAPYILRRMKTDKSIISDLPDKVETTRYCGLTPPQAKLYQQVVKGLEEALENAEQTGIQRRGLVLQTLMRLNQACNHPSQLLGDGAYEASHSGKFLQVAELCAGLAERQERVLVFTQFREIIDALDAHLRGIFGRPGLVLHGGTAVARRRRLVDEFQNPEGPPYMVLSLKAGGTGLTLTAASQVIHFDRWWNPAVEDQATDRAFRIGQKKNVLVHKFVTRGTVEEKIDAMIAGKRQVAGEVLGDGGAEIDITSLDDDQLLDLVRLDVRRAGEGA